MDLGEASRLGSLTKIVRYTNAHGIGGCECTSLGLDAVEGN